MQLSKIESVLSESSNTSQPIDFSLFNYTDINTNSHQLEGNSASNNNNTVLVVNKATSKKSVNVSVASKDTVKMTKMTTRKDSNASTTTTMAVSLPQDITSTRKRKATTTLVSVEMESFTPTQTKETGGVLIPNAKRRRSPTSIATLDFD